MFMTILIKFRHILHEIKLKAEKTLSCDLSLHVKRLRIVAKIHSAVKRYHDPRAGKKPRFLEVFRFFKGFLKFFLGGG